MHQAKTEAQRRKSLGDWEEVIKDMNRLVDKAGTRPQSLDEAVTTTSPVEYYTRSSANQNTPCALTEAVLGALTGATPKRLEIRLAPGQQRPHVNQLHQMARNLQGCVNVLVEHLSRVQEPWEETYVGGVNGVEPPAVVTQLKKKQRKRQRLDSCLPPSESSAQ
ncbi:unnamed protein product [Soboliphyme baturini]|uniref:Ribosome biogenesis regulatory protein n=1 Tax=Soboliphyme baturini TaxID=241478 RepID=A0A183IT27_9BILA|nr:unnamed protein product [Soboliphyme baturini]